MQKSFTAEIMFQKGGVVTTFWYILVPFNVEKIFKRKGYVPVQVTFDDIPYKCSLIPAGNGNHIIRVRKLILKKLGKKTGSSLRVSVALDTPTRSIEIPEDLMEALGEDRNVKKEFLGLPYSHKRELVVLVEESKHPATRIRRIERIMRQMRLRMER